MTSVTQRQTADSIAGSQTGSERKRKADSVIGSQAGTTSSAKCSHPMSTTIQAQASRAEALQKLSSFLDNVGPVLWYEDWTLSFPSSTCLRWCLTLHLHSLFQLCSFQMLIDILYGNPFLLDMPHLYYFLSY